jgi:hypothetical protein
LSICETADWYDLRLAYDGWRSKSFDDMVPTTEIKRVGKTGRIKGGGKGNRRGGGVDTCFKFLVLHTPHGASGSVVVKALR